MSETSSQITSLSDVSKKSIKLSKPVLIILRGAPATGKTTLAHALVEEIDNCVQINIDMLWSMLGFKKFEGAKYRAHESALYMSKLAIEAGQSAILSEMFNKKIWIDNAKMLSQKLNVPFFLFDLYVPFETCQYRIQTRNKTDLKNKPSDYVKDLYDTAVNQKYDGAITLNTFDLSLKESVKFVCDYLVEHVK